MKWKELLTFDARLVPGKGLVVDGVVVSRDGELTNEGVIVYKEWLARIEIALIELDDEIETWQWVLENAQRTDDERRECRDWLEQARDEKAVLEFREFVQHDLVARTTKALMPIT